MRSGCLKTVTNLHTFDSTDGHNGFGESGIELFKNRLTDSGRHSVNGTFNDSSGRILFFHTFF